MGRCPLLSPRSRCNQNHQASALEALIENISTNGVDLQRDRKHNQGEAGKCNMRRITDSMGYRMPAVAPRHLAYFYQKAIAAEARWNYARNPCISTAVHFKITSTTALEDWAATDLQRESYSHCEHAPSLFMTRCVVKRKKVANTRENRRNFSALSFRAIFQKRTEKKAKFDSLLCVDHSSFFDLGVSNFESKTGSRDFA